MAVIEDRKYQTDALDAVSAKWREGFKRVNLVMPTGSGKATCAARSVKKSAERGKRSLILVHRRNLVKQLSERMGEFGIRYSVVMANLPSADWVRQDHCPQVWIASKDTLLSRLGIDGWDRSIEPDLLFLDESHRGDEDKYSLLLSKCPAKYWLGLTATPIRPDGSGLGSKNWDCMVVGATVRDMVAGKWLVDIRVFAPPGVCRRRSEGKKVRVSGDPVDEWLKHAQGKRTIAFLPDVATARSVMDMFNAAKIPAAILSAQSEDGERDEILRKVKAGEILWLGNVGLFVEGMDCPELEVCQILRPMESMRAYIQAVGRIARPAPWIGKTHGILLDHSGASARHRYPEIEPEWKLDETGEQFEARHRERVEKELGDPIDCKKCGAVFAGTPKCPYCGTPVPPSVKRKPLVYDQEGLVAAGSKYAPVRSKEQKEWDKILWAARFNSLTCGAAFMMFKRKVKKTPQEAGVRPLFGYQQKDVPVGLAEQALRHSSAG